MNQSERLARFDDHYNALVGELTLLASVETLERRRELRASIRTHEAAIENLYPSRTEPI